MTEIQNTIQVRGAREHNLKNINVDIPRNKLVVITGLSGSGKSTLAFDTLYAEGQRRYVESLSSYARLFLGQMQKPDVDSISGLSPAIAIDQKTTGHNPRSTVGTVTEIYDYLRLLFARAGEVHCPRCGKLIEQQTVDQMSEKIMSMPEGTRMTLMAPVVRSRKGEYGRDLQRLRKEGFARARIDGEIVELEELPDDFRLDKKKKHTIEVVVDRLIRRDSVRARLLDSLETSLHLADGLVQVLFSGSNEEGESWEREELYSQNFACSDCGISIADVSPQLFSFNNPYGACPECGGLGELTEIDPELVIFDKDLSLDDGAIQAVGWNFADRKSWARCFIEALASRYDFSLKTPWKKLPSKVRELILFGNHGERLKIDTSNSPYARSEPYYSAWMGVVPSMNKRYYETSSDDMKLLYQRYLSSRKCSSCGGARLKPEALAVTVGGENIYQLCSRPICSCLDFLQAQSWTAYQEKIVRPIMTELGKRLSFLIDVGLDYLTLSRSASTLSGGEAQRIRLATQIGSGLMGVIYILDEPSIGLHQRDNQRLLNTLKHLRDLGNTVLVVEHDEETIRAADYILDIGPGAGEYGGELVAAGTVEELMQNARSITGQYLLGKMGIRVPDTRRIPGKEWLRFYGCRQNNLKNIDVALPLGVFNCITGVSGSGKSSLVNGIIRKKLEGDLNGAHRVYDNFDSAEGLEFLDKVIAIDQSPIGRTPRSNPATYTGVFDDIRRLFSETREARARGYKPGRFSFNVKGGRCEACKGDGVKCIEMHFLPDVYVECEVCHGRRYKRETLEVCYKDKNISDVLNMTVEEALDFFSTIPAIRRKLETLRDVGLGYIRLGQPSTQLSGGEAQRIKLASELSRRQTGRTFYILDEPTTGLHADDVASLIDILQRLTENGNTVLVIEHNLDVIKTADYVIDLGPEGGDGGGTVVCCGTPEEVAEDKESYTGRYLKDVLVRQELNIKG